MFLSSLKVYLFIPLGILVGDWCDSYADTWSAVRGIKSRFVPKLCLICGWIKPVKITLWLQDLQQTSGKSENTKKKKKKQPMIQLTYFPLVSYIL